MEKSKFTSLWKQYEALIKAFVELFHPFVEVAVHDLEKGKLVAIYHNISQRKVGDTSPIKELKVTTKDFPNYFTPYYKQNWDGRTLKCTSITIRDQKGKAVGLICINADVSYFQEGYRLLETFLNIKDEAENPIEIYGSQFESQVNVLIQEYLNEKNLQLSRLKRNQKKELVQQLYHKGVFNFKNATPYIAKILNSSRASIYNYINQIGMS